jgi:hypothetical protein
MKSLAASTKDRLRVVGVTGGVAWLGLQRTLDGSESTPVSLDFKSFDTWLSVPACGDHMRNPEGLS